MSRAQATIDHSVIRHWIEAHNGHPSVVRATQGRQQGSAGLLRVDFDEAEASLKEVSWNDFFDTFDTNNLAFLYQDERDNRFHKFVSRDSLDQRDLEKTDAESSTRRTAKFDGRTGDGQTRHASPAEQQEAEEIDEEDVEDEDEDEDEEDEDLDDNDEDEDEEKPSRSKKR